MDWKDLGDDRARARESFLTSKSARQRHSEVEAVLVFPASQAVQLEAPVEASVSVTEPAAQSAHADVDAAPYLPASQAVQLEAPVEASVLVLELVFIDCEISNISRT